MAGKRSCLPISKLAAKWQPPLPATNYQAPPSIQVGALESIMGVLVLVFGIGAAWATLKNSVANLDKTIREDIKPVLTDLRDRFAVVEDRVESLWKDKVVEAHSPRRLNERGREILRESGIKEIVDQNQKDLESVLTLKHPSTAYDVERAAVQIVMSLPKRSPEILGRLKDGAFKTGAELDMVLLVGGIYLRDKVLMKPGLDDACGSSTEPME
jgi:hypothetical protein